MRKNSRTGSTRTSSNKGSVKPERSKPLSRKETTDWVLLIMERVEPINLGDKETCGKLLRILGPVYHGYNFDEKLYHRGMGALLHFYLTA